MFLNLIPIFGVASAYLVLGERLALAQWRGAALILAAVTAIVRLQHRPLSTMALPQRIHGVGGSVTATITRERSHEPTGMS